jgi:hypothetical protein
VTITVDYHCYPMDKRTGKIGIPFHQLALRLLEVTDVKKYQLAQALDSLSTFWSKCDRGDAEPGDYPEKRRG